MLDVKSKTRKRLTKQVRKLIKRHGEVATTEYLAELVAGIVHRDVPIPGEDTKPESKVVAAAPSNNDSLLQPSPKSKRPRKTQLTA